MSAVFERILKIENLWKKDTAIVPGVRRITGKTKMHVMNTIDYLNHTETYSRFPFHTR